MNKIKYLIVCVALLISVGFLFAQPVSVRFADAGGSPLTKAALDLECVPLLGQGYTVNFPPAADRWVYQFYRDGGDGIISPLDPVTHGPTGDDQIATGTNTYTTGPILIGPTGLWSPTAAVFNPVGSTGGNTFVGDRIFLRFFNAPTIAAATKSMAFTQLYTITSSSPQNVSPYIPQYAWGPWTLIAPPPTEYHLTVESNYPGAAIYRNGTDTGFVTPHVFTEAGTYTVQLAGVTQWNPANYIWDGQEDASIRFMGVKTPNAVNAVYPQNGQTIHIAWNAPATAVYTLQWAPDPNPAAVAPDHYIVKWMDVVQTTVEATVTSWDTPAIGEGTYNWEIIPVVTDPAKGGRRTLQPVRATIANNAKGNGPSQQWTFTIQRDEQPTYNVTVTTNPEVNAQIYVGGVDSGYTTPHIFSWVEGTNAVITVVKDHYTFEPENYTINNLNADTECQFTATIVITTSVNGLPDGAIVGPDNITLSWNIDIVMPPDGFFKVYEDANNPPTTLIYTGTNTEFTISDPLSPGTYYWFVELHDTAKALLGTSGIRSFIVQNVPVELTSFNAVITSEMFVNLTWVTQSETNVMGFNIYRSDDNVADHAIRINNLMIPAAGTSSTAQTYRWVDSEVETGHTYYYWLQSVDLNGYSVMHNPISATVNTPGTPPVNELSVLNSIYPNPFSIHANSNVNISVTIKTGEVGTVTVYNLLGQVVKSFKVTSNQTNVTWNAKNAASGIYFVKLSTPTTNMTKKLVIVK